MNNNRVVRMGHYAVDLILWAIYFVIKLNISSYSFAACQVFVASYHNPNI